MLLAISPVWTIVITIFILVIIVSLCLRNYCFHHGKYKDLKAYKSKDNTRYCSRCIEDVVNPHMACHCGWSGRLTDCEEYRIEPNGRPFYNCPHCLKHLKTPA